MPLGAKDRLYFARVCSVMLYRNKTSPVKEKDLIRLEKNDTWMVRWMCNVRSEKKISAEELKTRLKLKSIKKCLEDRTLQWKIEDRRL